MTDRQYRKPITFGDVLRLQGNGLRMIGGRCCGCRMMNEQV
jgi:hypothetical protein